MDNDNVFVLTLDMQADLIRQYWNEMVEKYGMKDKPDFLVSNYKLMFIEGFTMGVKAMSDLSCGLHQLGTITK